MKKDEIERQVRVSDLLQGEAFGGFLLMGLGIAALLAAIPTGNAAYAVVGLIGLGAAGAGLFLLFYFRMSKRWKISMGIALGAVWIGIFAVLLAPAFGW
jgi:hypothetical protein